MSTNDRELLEMAAKAAGITIDPIDMLHEPSDWICWNPLHDDGDALRLASDCFIEIKYGMGFVLADGPQGEASESYNQQNKSMRIMATRRAIVRAAAEIGRAMP